MGTDWSAVGIMILLLLLPAAIVLFVFRLFQRRREKMRPQRITKRRSRKAGEEKETKA